MKADLAHKTRLPGVSSHARNQKVLSELKGSNFDKVYLVVEGREDPNTTIRGPSSGPNIECWLGSFVIFRRFGSVLLRNPIYL